MKNQKKTKSVAASVDRVHAALCVVARDMDERCDAAMLAAKPKGAARDAILKDLTSERQALNVLLRVSLERKLAAWGKELGGKR